MADREHILFCDESDRKGQFYSNFYGGLLIGSSDYLTVTDRLNGVKRQLNLFQEVKWSKVTEPYLHKYDALIRAFFSEVLAGRVKVRIMFTQNALRPTGLTSEHVKNSYWYLYYQFVKHSFGFDQMPASTTDRHLRLYFDEFPDTGEQVSQFKGYLHGLEDSSAFRRAKLNIRREDITEVRSHEHILLQCLDVVLGSMTFRLNNKHKEKPAGARVRGSRTIAKEKLYRRINALICELKPHFNVGITTGGDAASRWNLPYRHWLFKPSMHEYDPAKTKAGQKKNPA